MSDDECPELVDGRVPVTLLTGFLGSGKTTLLHYVLSAEHQLKIAVIVNEFEFGKTIEKGLTLKSSEKSDDEWLELKNGCMCCTAKSQTVSALESLMRRKGTFDLILVETSGLADPGPIAATFWQDSAVDGVLYLSGIVTVVDAVNIRRYLADPDVSAEAARQILMADRIILNKCDVATEEQQEASLAAVREINPVSEVVRSSHSRVGNLRDILFVDTTRTLEGLEHIDHRTTITAVPLEFFSGDAAAPLALTSRADVDDICRELLYRGENEGGFEVVRCKAALWCRDAEGAGLVLLQLQSIGDMFDVTPMEGQSVPFGCSRALVLGKRLDEEKLRRLFMQFLKPVPMSAA